MTTRMMKPLQACDKRDAFWILRYETNMEKSAKWKDINLKALLSHLNDFVSSSYDWLDRLLWFAAGEIISHLQIEPKCRGGAKSL